MILNNFMVIHDDFDDLKKSLVDLDWSLMTWRSLIGLH